MLSRLLHPPRQMFRVLDEVIIKKKLMRLADSRRFSAKSGDSSGRQDQSDERAHDLPYVWQWTLLVLPHARQVHLHGQRFGPHTISRPFIVLLPVENSPASMPMRWSMETCRLVSG
jgi:hypothetical protein